MFDFVELLNFYYANAGTPYSEIGGVIDAVIKPKGYKSVKEFCGHG